MCFFGLNEHNFCECDTLKKNVTVEGGNKKCAGNKNDEENRVPVQQSFLEACLLVMCNVGNGFKVSRQCDGMEKEEEDDEKKVLEWLTLFVCAIYKS